MSKAPPRVLVSACLLGQPVRYDGQSKGIVSDWLNELGAEGRTQSFCPEVAGGLPTPR
ncbi:TPA: 2-thiouracil desulfurase family protein, partial [Aeromonas salmonicida subsp. salmonicida]